MADNIKIIGNILNTTIVTRYSSDDVNLIASQEVKNNFGGKNDYIEFYVYDIGGNLLSTNYNYLDYKLPTNIGLTPGTNTQPNTTGNIQTSNVGVDSTLASSTGSLYPIIEIDPVTDLQNLGYSSGEFNVRYNFFQNKISDYSNRALYVKEISSDRTEIRLASTILSDSDIESTVNSIINEINNSTYYIDNLLNFGNGEQYVAVNVALNKASSGYEVLFKMYEPLPQNIQLKSALWVVHEKVDPYIFDINLDKLILAPSAPTLRGPNFDISIPDQGTIATSYTTYGNLVNSLQSLQQTSYNQLSNLIASQSADINVDYTNFNDFVFFGSAKQRLSNFYDKVQQIESYNNLITTYTAQTASVPSLQTEISQYSSNVNNIINQFDGYEYYLYFESSSYAWPKVNSTKPYVLQSTGSVSTWYNNLIDSAQDYDDNNYDNLKYAIPTYLRDDANNAPFLTFLNMVGHYFDNIWIYINSITDINLANNNLEEGISKDLVYERLKSLGVKLYNSQAGEALSSFLVGANTGSSTFDNNFTITGSYLNNIPRKDLVSELYKRIYHNLPLLAKTKGTAVGLGYLTTIFGITGSILNVKEYGGSTKNNLLNEYSTEKVRIVYNTVEDNVLSPNHSLQAQTTVYDDFRSEDTHYVDISFSPQTQIDTYAANAIHSQNPTWSLDDYIGDPRQQYSSSYGDLVTQRTKYYQTGVAGYPGFTGSLMDYNGFIRLIQYFDNALFKMLADYVPERTSLSTGVTINSPALERNKVVYSVPNVATQSVYTAQYSASSISPQYGHFYDVLQGDKKPYYDGNISGSTVDVHQYFVDNYNNYLGNWDVYNSQHSITQSINTNTFIHSDWNVLLNNVSSSVLSTKRKDIEYIYGTTGSILKPAELQDSYLTLRSYNTSRYEGSKLTSTTYNIWQTGDKSYGKTAVIDYNTYKLGWVKNIPSQSLNFYDKTQINLKYLVDADVNVSELSSANNNVFEVQNIFKSGNPVKLSLSNRLSPTNQVTLDGIKTIWKGGIFYNPIIYREGNEDLTFTFSTPLSTTTENVGVKAYTLDKYAFKTETGPNASGVQVFLDSIPTGNIRGGGKSDYVLLKNNQSILNPFSSVVYTNSWRYNSNYKTIFNINVAPNTWPNYAQPYINTLVNNSTYWRAYAIDLLNYSDTSILGSNTDISNTTYSKTGNYYYYKIPATSTYQFNCLIPITIGIKGHPSTQGNGKLYNNYLKIVGIVEKTKTPSNENTWEEVVSTVISGNGLNTTYKPDNTIEFDGTNGGLQSISSNLRITGETAILSQNWFIRFRLYIMDFSGVFTFSSADAITIYLNSDNIGNDISPASNQAYFEIRDPNVQVTKSNYTSTYTSTARNLFQSINGNVITLDQDFTKYIFYATCSFTPNSITQNDYTAVVDTLSFKPNDILRMGSFNSPSSELYNVVDQSYNYLLQTGAGFTRRATFYYDNSGPLIYIPSYDPLTFDPNKYFYVGASFNVTGTASNNTTYTVKSITTSFFNGTYSATIYVTRQNPFTSVEYDVNATFSTSTNTVIVLTVTLDRPITTNSINRGQSFALLRPVPDETSVILDFKKQPGDTSQAMLIPYNANTTLTNNVGTIYSTLNTKLQ